MKEYGRKKYIDKALQLFRRYGGETIVEIGSIREKDNIHGDGYSTVAWAQNAKEVYSVDINPQATALTIEETKEFGTVTAITEDGLKFMSNFNKPIDLLYLDAWDTWEKECQENHLRCYELAKRNFHNKSLLLIDDTHNNGKGDLVIPAAIKDGFSVVFADYQTLLTRKRVKFL